MSRRTLAAALAIAATAVITSNHGAGADDPGATFTTTPPARVYDSRTTGSVHGGNTADIDTGYHGARAVAVNVTVIAHDEPVYATAFDTGPVPGTSILNVDAGETDSNFVIVPLYYGHFRVFVSGDADVIVDVMGYLGAPELGVTPP